MKFEWDSEKSLSNKNKHKIDFETATSLWEDAERIEILAPYPLENRYIMIARLGKHHWTAIYTIREGAIRIISVRRSRKQEKALYEKEKASQK